MTEEAKAYLNNVYSEYILHKGNDKIQENEWLIYAQDAYLFMQHLTTDKFKTIMMNPKYDIQVKFTLINLTDLDYDLDKRKEIATETLGITSENVNSHSIQFATPKELVDEWEQEAHKKKVRLAQRYLAATGIFYRGLRNV